MAVAITSLNKKKNKEGAFSIDMDDDRMPLWLSER